MGYPYEKIDFFQKNWRNFSLNHQLVATYQMRMRLFRCIFPAAVVKS